MKMQQKEKPFLSRGFTITELLVVIAVMVILMALTIPFFRSFQKESDLIDACQRAINILRLAQNRTLASQGDGSWGVFFATSSAPHEITLFKGENFVDRDIAFDHVYSLPSSIDIKEINLITGQTEVVFHRLIGSTDQYGSIILRSSYSNNQEQTIFIEPYGQVGLQNPTPLSDTERLKDSRRVHIAYSRYIDLSEEKINLLFLDNGSIVAQEEIIIIDNLKDNQIYWQGEISIGDSIEKITIHTHRLNDPDTLLCIHRDRRYNNYGLQLMLSDDLSGTIIDYSADGLITTYTSIYVDDLQWQ